MLSLSWDVNIGHAFGFGACPQPTETNPPHKTRGKRKKEKLMKPKHLKIALAVVMFVILLVLSFRVCESCGRIAQKEDFTLKRTFTCYECIHGEPLNNEARINKTRRAMALVNLACAVYEMQNDSLPETIEELDTLPKYSETLNDAWGNPFQYKKVDKMTYELRSAGPDGRFGTADDITTLDR